MIALPKVARICVRAGYQGLQAAQPHLEDGSVYRPLRPTRLDEIKNFHLAVQASGVAKGLFRRFIRPVLTSELQRRLSSD